MKLTDTQIRAAKYAGKVQKLTDGNGLYLRIMPSGRHWRYDYRYRGVRKTIALGAFPAVTLKAARIALFEAKGKLEKGMDPSYQKQLAKYVNDDHSFKAVATEFMGQHDCTDRTRADMLQRLTKDAYPIIGAMSVAAITPQDVLHVIRRIEKRGALDVAQKVCRDISQVLRYSIYTGILTTGDPCRDLKGALRRKRETKRYAAIVKPEPFGELLRAIDTYSHNVIIAHAIQIAPYVALRPTELRAGMWTEIDFEGSVWNVPKERMKIKTRSHVVPLARQTLERLRSLHRITGRYPLMFPSPQKAKRHQPMSENTMNVALDRLGYPGSVHTPHGFRSSFSTMVNRARLFSSDAVEMQLAHLDKDRTRAAYHRDDFDDQRPEMMQWWADQIDVMRLAVPSREAQ